MRFELIRNQNPDAADDKRIPLAIFTLDTTDLAALIGEGYIHIPFAHPESGEVLQHFIINLKGRGVDPGKL